MDDNQFTRQALAVVNAVGIAVITGYFAAEYVFPYLKRRFFLPNSLKQKLQLQDNIQLNKYEAELAESAVHPSEITVQFKDIGGEEEVIGNLRRNLATMLHPPKGKLLQAPMGILLYGPPGCGKTMLAKALAKESHLRFLILPLSLVLDKWVGETEKYLEALFTLARKVKPCIIFLDEIDALTRRRSPLDRDWNLTMKSHLLSLWDGLLSSELNSQIIIIGATNRKSDIDEAFLRRMPLQIKVPLPGLEQRISIMNLLLADAAIASGFDYELIAEHTEGWSGSDLKELCRRVVLDHFYRDTIEKIEDQDFFPKIEEMLQEFRDSCEEE